jgi:hypothetical protein
MHFTLSTTSIVLSFLTGALAIPFEGQNLAPVVRRAKDPNVCIGTNHALAIRWDIWVQNEKKYNTQCGNGCLDNFRGRCGAVTDWGCDLGKDGHGYYHFTTQALCQDVDMQAAVKACTKGEINIHCTTTDTPLTEAMRHGVEIGMASLPEGKSPPKGGSKAAASSKSVKKPAAKPGKKPAGKPAAAKPKPASKPKGGK